MGLGLGLGTYLPHLLYAAIVIGSILSVLRPITGVYLIAVVMPLGYARERLFQFPAGNHILDLLLLGIAVGLLLKGSPLLPRFPYRWAVLGLVITSYISIWIAPALIDGVPSPIALGETPFGNWMMYMRLPALLMLSYSAIENRTQMRLVMVCMLVGFLWVNKGFHGTVGSRDTSHFSYNLREGARFGSANQNVMAAFQAQCVLLLLGLFAAERRWLIRIPMILAAAVGTYGTLFSYSRGAYVGIAVGLFYLGVFKFRLLLPALFLVLLGWQAILPDSVKERINMTYDKQEEALDTSAGERLNIWQHALRTTMLDPVLGVGYNCYQYHRKDEELKDTHNMYLRALVETGFVGLVFLVAWWIGAFRAAHRLFRYSDDPFFQGLGVGFGAYMVALFVVNLFGDRWTYIEATGFTVLLMALVLRATEIASTRTGMPAYPQAPAIPLKMNPAIPRRVPKPVPAAPRTRTLPDSRQPG